MYSVHWDGDNAFEFRSAGTQTETACPGKYLKTPTVTRHIIQSSLLLCSLFDG